MNYFRKGVISASLALVLVLSSYAVYANPNQGQEQEETPYVSIEEARNAAISHILTSLDEDGCNWKQGVKIGSSKALFDLDENPSAYMFKLEGKGK